MAYLEIKTDEGVKRVPLRGERLSIGRLTFNDVALPSPQISRQHAELRRIDGAWWIADLNSTNGLHFDGRRIQDHCLADGDEIALAPTISVRFVEETTLPEFRPVDSVPVSGVREDAAPAARSPAPRAARLAGFTASDADEQRKTHPVGQRAMQVYPPVSSPEQFVPAKPRSVYADDEVPFVPAGMAPPSSNPDAETTSPSRSGGPATVPYSSWHAGPLPRLSSTVENQEGSGIAETVDGSRASSGGYPVLPGVLQPGSDTFDPYRRSGPLPEVHGAGGGSVGNLLHVCQTCGQLTSPDSVYCQSCHHSIAHECSNCRLSLLPIQDRCPRCHTPNEFSVRRAHPGR